MCISRVCKCQMNGLTDTSIFSSKQQQPYIQGTRGMTVWLASVRRRTQTNTEHTFIYVIRIYSERDAISYTRDIIRSLLCIVENPLSITLLHAPVAMSATSDATSSIHAHHTSCPLLTAHMHQMHTCEHHITTIWEIYVFTERISNADSQSPRLNYKQNDQTCLVDASSIRSWFNQLWLLYPLLFIYLHVLPDHQCDAAIATGRTHERSFTESLHCSTTLFVSIRTKNNGNWKPTFGGKMIESTFSLITTKNNLYSHSWNVSFKINSANLCLHSHTQTYDASHWMKWSFQNRFRSAST